MADTPGNVVSRGQPGTGLAQVFARTGDPLQMHYAREEKKAADKAAMAAAAAAAKKERDKQMWDLINVDPEAAFAPFNQQVIDAANEHRQKIAAFYENGGQPDANFLTDVKAGWDAVNHKAKQSNHVKATIEETMKTIDDNPYLDRNYYFPKVWGSYMNAWGEVAPVENIDYEAIQNTAINDPRGFQTDKFFKDFNSDVKSNVINHNSQKNTNAGIEFTDIDTKMPGDFYTYNPDTNDVVRDENNSPVINITPTYKSAVFGNASARLALETEAKDKGVDVETVMQQHLTGKVGLDRSVKKTLSREPTGPWMYEQKEQKRKNAATNRKTMLDAVGNPILADGTVNPQAEAVVAALRNTTQLDGRVVETKIVPGTSTPGQFKFGGRNVANSPSNRIIFTVKTSDRGTPQVMEIDMDAPGWRDQVNGMLNYSPSETEKFSSSELQQITGQTWEATVPKVNEATKKKFSADQENFMLNKIMNAKVDEDLLPDLEGIMYNGQPIIGAKKVITEKGWITDDTAIQLQLPDKDGNEQYVEVKDIEEMRKVLQGQTAGVSAATGQPQAAAPAKPATATPQAPAKQAPLKPGYVRVVDKNGKTGQIPANKLEAALKAGLKKL